ncbi:MAG: choice-of-anchor J domain-containing protein, partial [Candidatus Eremiobacteraeota bacterium]|nr:choice-of-anchor J domain-containing protein [Candidatus Eremiobacteraeota bacterium]
QFRFRIETDKSITMDGVKLSDITVRDGDDQVLYRGDPGQVDLEGLLSHTRNGQVSTLVALDSMVTRLGSLQAAQKLWPLLAPFDQDPAFEERAMVLAELAAANGVAGAARVWPLLDDGHLYRDRQIAEAIDVLSSRPPEWTTQGRWGTELDPAYGPVWSDSPGGQYSDSTDASLITPEFGLAGQARLSFAIKTQTESVDKLHVEVAGQDGKWQELEAFSGKSDWRQVSYDLSAYQGQTARLRFHFTSDKSVTDEGVQLANIRVASPQKIVFHGDPPGPAPDDLFARLAAQPPDQRRATILGLASLADKVGGLQPATELWPVLADDADSPDFASITASAVALAGMASTRRVGEVWNSLKSHHPGQSFPRVLAELTRLLVLSGNLEEALAQLKTQVDLAVEDEHVVIDGFQVPIQD